MKIERGRKHNHALISDSAVTITQVKLGSVQRSKGAIGEKDTDGFEHVSDAAVGKAPAFMKHAPPTEPGMPQANSSPERSSSQAISEGFFKANAGLASHLGVVNAYAGQSVGNGNDHAAISRVRNKQVRARSQE